MDEMLNYCTSHQYDKLTDYLLEGIVDYMLKE